jgi:hypothetical protein
MFNLKDLIFAFIIVGEFIKILNLKDEIYFQKIMLTSQKETIKKYAKKIKELKGDK